MRDDGYGGKEIRSALKFTVNTATMQQMVVTQSNIASKRQTMTWLNSILHHPATLFALSITCSGNQDTIKDKVSQTKLQSSTYSRQK